jgi:hypothetical protein
MFVLISIITKSQTRTGENKMLLYKHEVFTIHDTDGSQLSSTRQLLTQLPYSFLHTQHGEDHLLPRCSLWYHAWPR